MKQILPLLAAATVGLSAGQGAASIYLNDDAGVTVAIGASMGTNLVHNVCDAQSPANTIDVDNATNQERHTQPSHV